MARRKRKDVDLAAWAKAHEAEAKRAERNAKIGGDIGEVWQTYAARCRREAVEVSRRDPLPGECDLAPVPVEVIASGNAWRDHLLALEALDAARFAEAKGVTA
jgi:hypothetical protein